MNKAELIAKLSDDAGITKTQAGAALDSFTEAIAKTLKKGDKVALQQVIGHAAVNTVTNQPRSAF